jgi:hypothetical protein
MTLKYDIQKIRPQKNEPGSVQVIQSIARSGGFIALISILIITAILEGVALVTSFVVSLAEQNIDDSQINVQNILDTESCQQIELLRLATDPQYKGNENIILPNGACTTTPID